MTDRVTDRVTDRIEVVGLRAFGRHGVLAHEGQVGQTFVVDLALDIDLSAAAASDALADTIDYGTLAADVADAVRSTRFDLIERLAGHILDRCLADPRVVAAEVRVAKPHAPVTVDVDHVAVRLRRERT